jgi:amino acid adenylation domain-containing protein
MKSVERSIIADYWIEKLKGKTVIDADQSSMACTDVIAIDEQQLGYFYKLTSGNETAEFTVLLTIFNILCQRYFEECSVVFSKGMGVKQDASLLYSFNNIQEKTLKQFLQEVKEEVQTVYKYADYDKQLFQFERYASFAFFYNTGPVSFPFSLIVNKRNDKRLHLSVSYSRYFVDDHVAGHFLSMMRTWIAGLSEYVPVSAALIPIVTPQEKSVLLNDLNATQAPAAEKTVITLFEEQVIKTPDNVAVVFNDAELSYQQLNTQANRLAHCLKEEYQVAAGDFVAVKLKRSEQLLIAILAILKTGAAYVPIDIDFPAERIAYMQEDAQCKVVIDATFLEENNKHFSEQNIQRQTAFDDLAYVIYTSGTTGKPKGVMITNRSVAEFINWCITAFDTTKFDVVFAATSHCFDLSVFEMFYPLSVGKKIRILDNALEIGANLGKDTSILLNTVPSAIRNIFEEGYDLSNVRIINMGGEALPVDVAKKLLRTGAQVNDLYGPTEDTVYSMCYTLSDKPYKTIPIGKPIANTQLYILDEHNGLMPVGVAGKLFISGAGLSKGYLNRPELTSEKFIPNPFRNGQRMYDTGDRARWMPDGNMEFLGRKDHQVKLRGYRIELAEIETVITQFSEAITQCVVDMKAVRDEEVLVGYYTSTEAIDENALRDYVSSQLPGYMVPSLFVKLSSFPLNVNGKVDRKVLKQNTRINTVTTPYVAPRNADEQALAGIWKEVLGAERVGVKDHFFELGGHSLMISQVINRMHKRMGKGVSFKIFYSNPTIETLVETLRSEQFAAIPTATEAVSYPATPSQRRLWMLSQLDGGTHAYRIMGAKEFRGRLHVEHFLKAFDYAVKRHESLRTYFKVDEKGRLQQHVLPPHQFEYKVAIEELSGVEEYIKTSFADTFNLLQAPLFQAALIKLNEEHFVFLFSIHHIVADGWSIELLTAEVLEAYNQLQSGNEPSLSALSVQFKDYAVWLQETEKQESFAQSKAYWIAQFQGELPVFKLPVAKHRPAIKTFNGKQLSYSYSKEFSERLKQFAQQQHVTPFMMLLSAVRLLLCRYGNEYDVTIGTPIAGREHPDLENQVGLYLNTLAIRTQLDANDTFIQAIEKEKQRLLEAYSHQQFPFDALVESMNLERDASRSPLFDVMVVLQNQQQLAHFRGSKAVNEIAAGEYRLPSNTSKFDLTFTFEEKDVFSLEIEYNTDIYDESFVSSIFYHLERSVLSGIQDPDIKIKEIDILTSQEKQVLLEDFNSDKLKIPNKTIVDSFYEQALLNPGATAVVFEDRQLSYAQLNEQSNQLANHLSQQHNISTEDLIVIELERSERIIVAILAILKLGAAYVPVDPKYPAERIAYILQDTKAKLVIDDQLMNEVSQTASLPATDIHVKVSGEALAYVIYTSGSTGAPKGVMISHRSLMNFISFYNPGKHRTTLAGNIVFDVTVMEIFSSMFSGSTLFIPHLETVMNPQAYAQYLHENKITHCYILSMHVEEVAGFLGAYDHVYLRQIFIGVEGIRKEAVTWYHQQGITIVNAYGPTEATVCSTTYLVGDPQSIATTNLPIGKPLPNFTLYIFNEDTQVLQPQGCIGELCVSGIGLARGYLNRDELTLQKFQANSLATGERIYRTGDLARWLPDGNIEFIGRKDLQVKIRGNRVELGEIEHYIATYQPGFTNILVQVKDVSHEKVLVAYYITTEPVDKSALRRYLQTKLPAYMVPNYYVELSVLPLTINGKTDRSRLPGVTEADIIRKEFVPPATVTEKKAAALWKQLLGQNSVGINDDFFELGGNSLLLTKLLNEYNRVFKAAIDFKALYTNTTLAGHAALIDSSAQTSFEEIAKASEKEFYQLSSSQTRYWLIYKINGRSKEFNIYSEFALPAGLDIDAFEYAFNALTERHEILRTVFTEKDGIPMQNILPAVYTNIDVFNTEHEAKDSVYDHEFDLHIAPLYKVALAKREDAFVLFFNMHHIISDGWTMNILLRDLMELYHAKLLNTVAQLPELAVQYKDYAEWQNSMLYSKTLTEQGAYWKETLSGDLPYLQLPIDYSNKAKKAETSHSYTVFLTEAAKQKIATLSQKKGASAFAVFVAALKLLLNRLTAQKDIIIGIPAANRSHYQLKDVAGCFLNTLLLRDQVSADVSFQSLLKQVNNTLMNALANQQYPFEQLLEQLEYPKDSDRFPITPVFLNMLDFEARTNEFINDFNAIHGELPSSPKFDLECYIKTYANGCSINCVYDGELFRQETIAYWIDEYVSILSQVADDAGKPLQQLNIFTKYLYQQEDPMPSNTFECFEDSEIEQSIADRFEKIAARFPDRTAVYADNRWLTYRQLNNNANHLANKILAEAGANTKRIALLLDHNETCVAGMLAVLKAGYAYVPIDVNNPLSRIEYILKDSGAGIIICSAATIEKANKLQSNVKVMLLTIDETVAVVPDLAKKIDPLSEAYVLYTSGSTGEPKGVVQVQRNVLHYIRVYTNNVHISKSDNLSVFSTYTFDASVKDIYGAILNGATVSIYDIRENGVNSLAAWLRLQRITIIHMVPTIYRHFLKSLSDDEMIETVRLVDLGGEPCYKADLELFKQHFVQGAFLVNDYGPTESTIVSQKFLSHQSVITRNSLPMGKPVVDTAIFLLDENLNKLGIYQEGEIAFSSDYISSGYLNRKELTQRAFLDDPHNPGKRMYRSGDIGRMLPNGEIEFIQRKDTQVKLNGLRIELSEIEYHLERTAGINEAVVLLKEINGNNVLTAYVRKEEWLDNAAINESLRERLPKNMIPSVYISMDAFPFTRTGKIDRAALPQPVLDDLKTLPYQAPETVVEKTLAAIWADVLKMDVSQAGVQDNFFEMGGNSLLAVKLANKIEKQFGVAIRVKDIFNNSSIRELAQLIQSLDKKQQLHIPVIATADDYALSANQRRLWITCQTENSAAYNIPGALMLTGDVDTTRLREAFVLLMERHESLRTVFVTDEKDLPRQKIVDSAHPVFEIQDADYDPSPDALSRIVNHESNIPFDLNGRQLARVRVIAFPGNKYLLLVVMHHIISDGWSMEIFIKEWIALYAGLELQPAAIQYKDFAAWQQQYLSGPAFDKMIAYWKKRLSGDIAVLKLPVSKSKINAPAAAGELAEFSVNDELYAELNKLALAHNTSLYSVLFTAFNVLMHHISHQQRIVLGTSVAGRRHEHLEPIIGFFVNTLAISTTLDGKESFVELLKRTSEDLLNDFEHQDMPFDELLNHLDYTRQPGVTPLFQARFVLNNQRDDDFSGLDQLGIQSAIIKVKEVRPKFNLSMVMHYGKHLSGNIEYKTALFEKEVVQLMITAYLQLLGIIIKQPGLPVEQLDTFNKAYQEHLNRSKAAIQDSFLKKLQTLQKR